MLARSMAMVILTGEDSRHDKVSSLLFQYQAEENQGRTKRSQQLLYLSPVVNACVKRTCIRSSTHSWLSGVPSVNADIS
jgi:hypothetical protein